MSYEGKSSWDTDVCAGSILLWSELHGWNRKEQFLFSFANYFFVLFWDSVTIYRLGQLSIHDLNVLGSQKLHSHISGFVNIWHLFFMPFPSNIYSRKLKWLLKLVILLTISNGALKLLGFFFSYSNVLFPHHVGSYGTAT